MPLSGRKKLIEGRIALIRAEWLKNKGTGNQDGRGREGIVKANWKTLAQQAKQSLVDALRINQWLERIATPYLQRAERLLIS